MRAPRTLLFATYAAVGVYVAVLLLVPDLFAPWFRDTVLGNLAFVAAVALLVRRAAAEPATRFWTLPLATGTTVYWWGTSPTWWPTLAAWRRSPPPRMRPICSPTPCSWPGC